MFINKINMKTKILLFFTVVVLFCWSCGSDNPSGYGEPYDSSKPVELGFFEPDSGGMGTKLFITGKNFGNDPKNIKVYYNDMRASVVGSDGSHVYAITPRQPGESCKIAVVVGKDSLVFDKEFKYHTMVTVTTIAGQKGTTTFKEGTLAEATFDHPSTLCVDAEGNIFMSHWRVPFCFVLINEKKNIVQAVYSGSNDPLDAVGAPTADAEGKVIMAPSDDGDGYFSFDPDAQWSPKRRVILHPTNEEQAAGMMQFSINWKHGLSACKLDGYIYTRSFGGQLIKFHPSTRTGQLVADGLLPNTDSYLSFDPVETNILYITYPNHHAIFTYNILTGEHKLFAGTLGTRGYKDGPKLEAELNAPVQLVVDGDGSIIFADRDNHCIRKITRDGMVSTIIGKGGVAGYQDGNPEDALFNSPRGVAIDKDYNIYIADYENNCIRKLAIE
jgi:hypothetical protein